MLSKIRPASGRCAICHERAASPEDGLLCDPCFWHFVDHDDEPCPSCPRWVRDGEPTAGENHRQ